MKYVLRKADFSDELEIEISAETYDKYKESKKILYHCLSIEENYEAIILTYLDFEKQIFNAAVSNMVRRSIDPLDAFEIRLDLNIHLMSFLTSTQLYKDQFCHHIKECAPHVRDAETLAKSFLSKEYDENPEYRFMEQFRNHVQHFDLPIHWISSGMRWTDLNENGLLEYSMDIGVKKSFLEENKKFKRNIINESPDEINLKSTTRSYVESLSKAHESARELITESVQNARKNLEDAYSQFRKVYTEHSGSLSACVSDDEKVIETIPLMIYLDDIRMKLQERNLSLTNLRKRYVTGKTKFS